MSFNIEYIDDEVSSCVYRLYYGEKYIIVKGKTLAGSIFLIEKGYAYFIAGGQGTGNRNEIGEGQKEGTSANWFYWKFYKYFQANPNLTGRIEIILESPNGYQLLKAEQIELNKSFSDDNCLNNNTTSYIPIFRKKSKSNGWISKYHVMCFRKFLKRM